MKHNKTTLCATEQFQKDISLSLSLYYKQAISDSIKKALKMRKNRTIKTKLQCKAK